MLESNVEEELQQVVNRLTKSENGDKPKGIESEALVLSEQDLQTIKQSIEQLQQLLVVDQTKPETMLNSTDGIDSKWRKAWFQSVLNEAGLIFKVLNNNNNSAVKINELYQAYKNYCHSVVQKRDNQTGVVESDIETTNNFIRTYIETTTHVLSMLRKKKVTPINS